MRKPLMLRLTAGLAAGLMLAGAAGAGVMTDPPSTSETIPKGVIVQPASYKGPANPKLAHVSETRQGDTVTITRADGSTVVKTLADKDTASRVLTAADTDVKADVYDGCQTYYPAGAVITLATAAKDDDCWTWDPADPNRLAKKDKNGVDMQFLGWNEESAPRTDVTNSDEERAAHIVTEITMPDHAVTVYAVWASRPVLNYDMNLPLGAQLFDGVSQPGSVSTDYNTSVEDKSGWQDGATDKVKGYAFLGWYTTDGADGEPFGWRQPGDTEGGTGTPLTQASTTVYAHWLQRNTIVRYDANGGEGKHGDTIGPQYSTITSAKDLNDPDRQDAFHRTGYKLGDKWNTCPDPANPKPGETCVAYTPGDGVPVTDRPVTLYAQWTPLLGALPQAGGDWKAVIDKPLAAGLATLAVIVAVGAAVMAVRSRKAHKAAPDKGARHAG